MLLKLVSVAVAVAALEATKAARLCEDGCPEERTTMLSAGGKASGTVWNILPRSSPDSLPSQHWNIATRMRLNAVTLQRGTTCCLPRSNKRPLQRRHCERSSPPTSMQDGSIDHQNAHGGPQRNGKASQSCRGRGGQRALRTRIIQARGRWNSQGGYLGRLRHIPWLHPIPQY